MIVVDNPKWDAVNVTGLKLPTAEEVLARLRVLFRAENDTQLARTLRIPQTTVSNWRNRKSVPYELCVSLAAAGSADLDYLIFGKASNVVSALQEIDLEIMDCCLNSLGKMAAAGFETAHLPVWQTAAYSYNAWVAWLRKTAPEGETRNEAIARLRAMTEQFTGLPDGLLEILQDAGEQEPIA